MCSQGLFAQHCDCDKAGGVAVHQGSRASCPRIHGRRISSSCNNWSDGGNRDGNHGRVDWPQSACRGSQSPDAALPLPVPLPAHAASICTTVKSTRHEPALLTSCYVHACAQGPRTTTGGRRMHYAYLPDLSLSLTGVSRRSTGLVW